MSRPGLALILLECNQFGQFLASMLLWGRHPHLSEPLRGWRGPQAPPPVSPLCLW